MSTFRRTLAMVRCKSNGLVKLTKNLCSKNWLKNSQERYNSSVTNDKTKVLLETIGNKGLISLNRPEALNAFNLEMLRQVTRTLKQWEDEQHKVLILIRGSGGKVTKSILEKY